MNSVPSGIKNTKRGRPREFDRTQALESAMILFWRNGYRGVSLDDLTAVMGITRPSLYAAFGDKEALFVASIDCYRDTVMKPVFRRMMAVEDLRSGLTTFFAEIAQLIASPDTPGCFIACMLSQECCESPEIKAKLAALVSAADQGFRKVLSERRTQLQDQCNPDLAAQLLTSVLHGLAIRARCGAPASELAAIGAGFVQSICK